MNRKILNNIISEGNYIILYKTTDDFILFYNDKIKNIIFMLDKIYICSSFIKIGCMACRKKMLSFLFNFYNEQFDNDIMDSLNMTFSYGKYLIRKYHKKSYKWYIKEFESILFKINIPQYKKTIIKK